MLVVALCLVAGVTLGLLGGGGSILAVPIFVHVGGMEPRSAIASSLLVVGVASAAAAVVHALRGRVDGRAGLTLGLASMAGAYGGGRAGQLVPASWLLAAFTVVMAITAVSMMRPRPDRRSEARAPLPRTIAVGLGAGAVTGLVGAGGGFVLVPALVLLCGLPMRRAIGTSLLVIAMNAGAGFAGAASAASLDGGFLVAAVAAATAGALLGVVASSRVAASSLRRGFAWLVLVMTFVMAAGQVPDDVAARLAALAGRYASHVVAALGGAAAVAAAWLVVHLRRPSAASHRGASAQGTLTS